MRPKPLSVSKPDIIWPEVFTITDPNATDGKAAVSGPDASGLLPESAEYTGVQERLVARFDQQRNYGIMLEADRSGGG